MKKLFILATAVLATVACSKTEVLNETPENGPAIAFQVANYAGQTKAGETSLITEGFNNFKTYAWYTSSTASNQEFMAPATVTWDPGNTQWAPSDRTYYWPKTGYINFFSFAGKHFPDAVDLNSSENNRAEAHYTTAITVATNDNILVADGAYGFYNNDAAQYKLDGVTKGVPTLFRHMLSRVKFDVKVDATDAEAGNHWIVTVTSATVSYRNQGKLEVVFQDDPTIALGTDNKPTAAGTTAKYVSQVWNPESVANVTLTNAGNVVVETDGNAASAAKILIADSVVMPQTLTTTGVTVALTYTLEYTNTDGINTEEVVPIAATALTSFSPSIAAWEPNTIYTYHIVIKPAANNKILFDPAVETWAEIATPTYTIE